MKINRTIAFRWLGGLLLLAVLADLVAVSATNGRFPGSKGLPKTLLIGVRGEGRSYFGVIERDGASFRFVNRDDPGIGLRLRAGDPTLFETRYYEHRSESGVFSPTRYVTSGTFDILSDPATLPPDTLMQIRTAFADYIATDRGDPVRAARSLRAPWTERGWIWQGVVNDVAIGLSLLFAICCFAYRGSPPALPTSTRTS